MTAPLCDLDPEHGPMQQEHIYRLDGTIDDLFGLYWFCQVKDCDGYGGKVETPRERVRRERAESPQLELFESE